MGELQLNIQVLCVDNQQSASNYTHQVTRTHYKPASKQPKNFAISPLNVCELPG